MRKGYLTPPVLIVLALICLFVAATLFINTGLLKNIKKQPAAPSPTPSATPSTQKVKLPSPPRTNEPQNAQACPLLRFARFKLECPDGWTVSHSKSGTNCLSFGNYDTCLFSPDYEITPGGFLGRGMSVFIDFTADAYPPAKTEDRGLVGYTFNEQLFCQPTVFMPISQCTRDVQLNSWQRTISWGDYSGEVEVAFLDDEEKVVLDLSMVYAQNAAMKAQAILDKMLKTFELTS